ncbi:MAG: sugar transferase [Bacteroidetes bacterium]|nr:sugar transferase [Bacteroidota bacterium]
MKNNKKLDDIRIYFFVKRSIDILTSLFLMLLLLPMFLIISAMIIFTSGFPIFFYQERMGKDWKSFMILKFRTMIKDADKMGPGITSSDDKRITSIGKILRKLKLDELPQLINVIRGDMSLIGPRPELPKYVNYFKTDYSSILNIKPGITDYAAIKFIDEESLICDENIESIYLNKILPSKIVLYKKYINDISFLTDIKILFSTLKGLVT